MKLQIMNAAGTIKTIEQLKKILRCEDTTEVTVGSYTLPQRNGNVGNRLFYYDEARGISLNSLGIPNGGLEFLKEYVGEMHKLAVAAGKRLRVSISGTPDEICVMAAVIHSVSVDIIVEVNGSCPNVWSEVGKQKAMAGFIPSQVALLLKAAATGSRGKNLIAIKLPIFSNPAELHDVVDRLIELHKEGVVHELVYANAYPNAFLWDLSRDADGKLDPRPVIDFGTGLAGGAGPSKIDIVIGGLMQIVPQVSGTGLLITGTGAISSGWALAQHVLCGVDKVQANTVYYAREQPTVFPEILVDFHENYPEIAARYS